MITNLTLFYYSITQAFPIFVRDMIIIEKRLIIPRKYVILFKEISVVRLN